jgi:hypothetical protein
MQLFRPASGGRGRVCVFLTVTRKEHTLESSLFIPNGDTQVEPLRDPEAKLILGYSIRERGFEKTINSSVVNHYPYRFVYASDLFLIYRCRITSAIIIAAE